MTKTEIHTITLKNYSLEDICEIIQAKPKLNLDKEIEANIRDGANFVKEAVEQDQHIYGVNTGFGSLCETRINSDDINELQYNIIVSHACGIGELVTEEISRFTMFIKILTFRTGHTGITLTTVNRLLDFWNNDIVPVTPRKGTVGASGDLAPLAHMALPLIGLGQVYFRGQLREAAQVLAEMNWSPLILQRKEGLALINGVQYITSVAAYCLKEINYLIKCADLISAMSIQAFSASRTFYHEKYNSTSMHLDRHIVAANLRTLLESSNHFKLSTCNTSMQDPYSFRCIPQVHGAIRQTFHFAKTVVEQECNSVGDNPLFFPKEKTILFGGNLHGESIALILDFLAIALSELASISERRSYQLLSGERGLPDFLVKKYGLHSGFMVVQYTAAALVNENKVLATPASIDTIPTSQLQEDHVSMGGTAAHKLSQIVENTRHVLAIELFLAAQAIQLNEELRLSPMTQRVLHHFRQSVSFLERDRVMSEDIRKAYAFFEANKAAWATQLQ